MFVDKNGLAAYHDNICQALHHQAVISAYEIYGFPDKDPRQYCLNDDKCAISCATWGFYLILTCSW